MRSASVPAGNASRHTGRVVAACTNATIAGEGFSVAMNQPAARSCIQLPMFEISAANQRTAKLP